MDHKSQKKVIQRKRSRFILSFVLGLFICIFAKFWFNWEISLLIAWDSGALILIALIYLAFQPDDGQHTKQITLKEGVRYPILDILIIVACLASLVIGIIIFTYSKGNPIEIIFCIVSIFCSWNLIHILYTVHYSEMYYKKNIGKKEGGVDFNNKELPNFWDFIYLPYTIGMTYQVSDTNFSTTEFRKVALGQTLISFLFSTVLISTMVNSLASIMR
ncbi:hypothetical protein AO467_04565 [Oenococcus oeni]|uniref:DUF1345 domain-containing protein n=1 Tax=Oenococcus oeni TaxID=1247 RepID=UPI000BDF8F9D|nr:DUF1345 domain-containing protein [Oenococcus oeni]PDH95376.1 hypothetical protein AO467_04565 [Oenococcus oeni]